MQSRWTRQNPHLMALLTEPQKQVPADEAGRPCDEGRRQSDPGKGLQKT